MKSKCLQLFTFFVEQLSFRNKLNMIETPSVIKNEKLVQIIAELIKLIISSMQDILKNKQKFDIIQKPKEGLIHSDNCYNTILFNMVLILLRCFIREPIKSEFCMHMKYFVLNIVFPLISSSEEEKDFLEKDPYTYQIYINDSIYNYKFRNFRTALCYLISKISDNFLEMKSFILCYVVEMINYIFNMEGKTPNNNSENYNIYLKSENKSLINSFNDEIKIDFCFLLLLVLKDNILNNNILKAKFFTFLIYNQDKIHQINSYLILIKICKIYKDYSTDFFEFLQMEKNMSLKMSAIEKMINFLLAQLLSNNKDNSNEILISEASETIFHLIKFANNASVKNMYIKEIVIGKLQACFKSFVQLIDKFDNPSLIIVISSIIENIHINDRQDIINCLNNFTKKFVTIVSTNYNNLEQEELKDKAAFITQYFIILKNYLRGENKFDISNKNEIIQFNKIISPVISYISKPTEYSFYEEIVNFGEYYIKAFESINEISFQILDNLYQIIDNDKILAGTFFSFISTFLLYINKNENHKPFIDKIIDIIKLTFSFPTDCIYEDILDTLLLNLQVLGFEGQIEFENLKFLLLENINLYFSLFVNLNKKELEEIFVLNDICSIDKIRQVIPANISLFFIYYPDFTFKVLSESLNGFFAMRKRINHISEFFNHLFFFELESEYYSNLGKCDILCLCAIYRNPIIFNSIFDNDKKKLSILRSFIAFAVNHKNESVKAKSRIIKDHLNCDFVNSDDENEDSENIFNTDESDEEFDNIFYENVQNCLMPHNLINNSDEFKIFSETFYIIKNRDENILNDLLASLDYEQKKIINNLIYVRNIKIDYNGKKIEVPRKTLKIIRNINA